jgi:hypothetical protein
MLWHWRNDPERLPDDDHARCIAAPDDRVLVFGRHAFRLTTNTAGRHFSRPDGASRPGCPTFLMMEYLGVGWSPGSVARFWRSTPFDGGPLGKDAQYAAGLALMETVAVELAAA